jgi:RNA polymerase sigma factor (sigma-70 family)
MTGDTPARELQLILETKRASLLRVATGILRDPVEAEDILQDSLAAVLKRSRQVEITNLQAYLFRAVQVNALKLRARRRRELSLETIAEPAAPELSEEEPSIEPLELEDALLGLPETQQVVIRLKYYLGYTFREIGEVLSISANTAASRTRYGLSTLRRALSTKQKRQKEK